MNKPAAPKLNTRATLRKIDTALAAAAKITAELTAVRASLADQAAASQAIGNAAAKPAGTATKAAVAAKPAKTEKKAKAEKKAKPAKK